MMDGGQGEMLLVLAKRRLNNMIGLKQALTVEVSPSETRYGKSGRIRRGR